MVEGWKQVLKKACKPSFKCGVVAVAWFAVWVYILVGAAIFRAIENPTRSGELATSAGQGELTYLQGLGDIVPVTDQGRGFMYVWAFFGCGMWVLMIAAVVALLYQWVLFGLLLYPWWQASGKNLESAESHFTSHTVLSWKVVFSVILVALIIYFGIHLAGAGIFLALEPSLGNQPQTPYFPNTLGDALYFSISASQTICMGNDYNPKTPEGMGFWLAWHPIALASSCFLFSTAVVAMLKWINSRLISALEKMLTKLNRVKRKRKRQQTEMNNNL